MPEDIGRWVRNVFGRVVYWAAENPGSALLVFVLIFIGLIVIFAVKRSRK
jgi:hypothetical protein